VNILRYLREQAHKYDCDVCGANHAGSEIKLLSKVDGAWIVRVTCSKCDTSLKLKVYPRRDYTEIAALRERILRPRRRPISLDDVIDAHDFLERFDGDARALFASNGKVAGSTEA
jgi:hypothetical protein